MGARRKQETQVNWRRWLRPLLVLALAAGAWQLVERLPAELMPIENVQIEGAFVHLSRSDIQRQLSQVLRGDYFKT